MTGKLERGYVSERYKGVSGMAGKRREENVIMKPKTLFS